MQGTGKTLVESMHGREKKYVGSRRFLLRSLLLGLIATIQVPMVLRAQEAMPRESIREKDSITVGWYRPMLSETDIKDVNAAIHVWIKQIAADEINIESIIYDDLPSMIQGIRHNHVQWLNLPPISYFRMKKEIDLDQEYELIYAAQMYGEGKARKYYIVVRDDAPYTSIRDLRNTKFATREYNETGRLYVNTLLLEEGIHSAEQFFTVIDEKQRYSQIVLGVFFKQYDAGMVPDGIFKTMGELNPQINRQLRIIAASDAYVNAVGLLSRQVAEATKHWITTTVLDLQNSVEGRQLLNLFKLDSMTTIDPEELQPVKTLLEEYMMPTAGARR